MDKGKLLEAIKSARGTKERKFAQSFDLIINLKDLNLKKPDEQIDLYIALPEGLGKERRVCGLVGPELVEESRKELDHTITLVDFETLDKKAIKKLTEEYDFFVAQANIMAKVAGTFGRIFGPRNKMPNPKGGCVVPPKANLKPVKERLNNTIRVLAKKSLVIQTCVGRESMTDEQIAENILFSFGTIVHALPKEQNNIRNVFIKTTMGQAVQVE